MNTHQQVQERLLSLSDALQRQLPTVKTVLKDILILLKQDAEVVTIMSEEEIAGLMTALQTVTSSAITTSPVKKKAMKNLALDDL